MGGIFGVARFFCYLALWSPFVVLGWHRMHLYNTLFDGHM